MKKHTFEKKSKTSQRAAELMAEVKTDELQSVAGGYTFKPPQCLTCGLANTVQ